MVNLFTQQAKLFINSQYFRTELIATISFYSRCDDTTGTCLNQRAICTAIETRRISFYFQWRRFGETGFRNRTGRTVEHLKCGCNDTITYGCT